MGLHDFHHRPSDALVKGTALASELSQAWPRFETRDVTVGDRRYFMKSAYSAPPKGRRLGGAWIPSLHVQNPRGTFLLEAYKQAIDGARLADDAVLNQLLGDETALRDAINLPAPASREIPAGEALREAEKLAREYESGVDLDAWEFAGGFGWQHFARERGDGFVVRVCGTPKTNWRGRRSMHYWIEVGTRDYQKRDVVSSKDSYLAEIVGATLDHARSEMLREGNEAASRAVEKLFRAAE
jgi:hypothetical protein